MTDDCTHQWQSTGDPCPIEVETMSGTTRNCGSDNCFVCLKCGKATHD